MELLKKLFGMGSRPLWQPRLVEMSLVGVEAA